MTVPRTSNSVIVGRFSFLGKKKKPELKSRERFSHLSLTMKQFTSLFWVPLSRLFLSSSLPSSSWNCIRFLVGSLSHTFAIVFWPCLKSRIQGCDSLAWAGCFLGECRSQARFWTNKLGSRSTWTCFSTSAAVDIARCKLSSKSPATYGVANGQEQERPGRKQS